MLLALVALYLLASVGIGLYAATRVHGTRDFAVAGRSLPFHVVMATVFATWFGSETVLGIPARFLEGGLGAVVAAHQKDPQYVLPLLVLGHMPVFAQVMFFGALLSAIMSTASGTLLAPSVTFTENVLRRWLPADLPDRKLLWIMRGVIAVFAALVVLFALDSDSSIYEMVGNAYKVTLVCAFVPLVAGLYWKGASTAGALTSIALGGTAWLSLEWHAPQGLVPPQLAGLAAAALGMAAGSLAAPQARPPSGQ